MKLAKFGPGGNSSLFAEKGHKSSLDAPAWVKEMNLDAYEYECGNGVSGSEETFARIGLKAAEYGVATSLHSPYYISLSGVVEEKRIGSIKYILQSVNAAKLLGATTVVVHAGSAAKIDRNDALNLAKDTLEKTIVEVEKIGFGNVKIGLETMGKINQLGTVDEIIEFCKIDPRYVPVVDFGHLYARSLGENIITSDDIKRIFDKISSELGAEVAENLHCHYSCIEYSKGGELKHLTFDNDKFGPDPVMFAKTIRELGVYPTVICESAGTQDVDAKFLKSVYLGAI
ncbi:MAG: endonuclease IV [Ruminococcaceae bacterium]|nr:endonuclease IV [Oscillospiraceae bacterium]